jgi:hypothetical protein
MVPERPCLPAQGARSEYARLRQRRVLARLSRAGVIERARKVYSDTIVSGR